MVVTEGHEDGDGGGGEDEDGGDWQSRSWCDNSSRDTDGSYYGGVMILGGGDGGDDGDGDKDNDDVG